MHVESYVKISRCVENVYVRCVENHIENRVEVQKKTPSHFTARVEIERQISFFSFGFITRQRSETYILVYLNKVNTALTGIM